MVWIVEWRYPAENDSSVTVWPSETDAHKAACRDILNEIRDYWDLQAPMQRDTAKLINDLIKKGHFRRAISEWNDCDLNCNSGDDQYWYVYEVDARAFVGDIGLLDESLFANDDEEEDSSDSDDEEEEYLATEPGAICRGPCKQHSVYAYANRRDGTYVCCSCRLMSQVFGNPIT